MGRGLQTPAPLLSGRRSRSSTRRRGPLPPAYDLVIDVEAQTATTEEAVIELGSGEAQILQLLNRSPGVPAGTEVLAEVLYGFQPKVTAQMREGLAHVIGLINGKLEANDVGARIVSFLDLGFALELEPERRQR